jgi:hypothetical protein
LHFSFGLSGHGGDDDDSEGVGLGDGGVEGGGTGVF